MKLLLFVLMAGFLFTTCNKNSEETAIQNGSYKGTFKREISEAGNISSVELTFTNGNWSGGSDVIKYPALCHGRYQISKRNIQLQNDCIWTAEFDWSLILSGSYQLKLTADSLQITREYPGVYRDIYRLKKL